MKQFKITNSITNREGTSVEKYFSDVAKQPLLTPEEEVTLAKKIKEGNKEALDKLVKANLRFVVSVAKQFQYGKVPFIDLINEGNIGLIKAAKMFDATRGFKFISYAVWWIRQSIMKALSDHSRLVRVPSNKISDLQKLSRAAETIEQETQREATLEELAEVMHIEVEDIENIKSASTKQVSLDAPFEENDSNCLLDILKDPNVEAADKELDHDKSLEIEMKKLFSSLTDQEREVIRRSFGIGCEYPSSLDDIGSDLRLSKERVRQIKDKAIKKMRREAKPELLMEYSGF
jgi:RNA polymerase primary sigma factor